jgi:hypothetical protein
MWDAQADSVPTDTARRCNPDLQKPCSEGVWSSSLSSPGRRPVDPYNKVTARTIATAVGVLNPMLELGRLESVRIM